MKNDYQFEEALARLEDISEQLEKGDLTLEQALNFFEEGIKLVKICSKRLNEAEGKIQVLMKELNGDFSLKDYCGGSESIE